jgi:hypothetical protein
VSPYGRVRVWVFHITYRNVFFMIKRYSLPDLTIISLAELFNKEKSLFGLIVVSVLNVLHVILLGLVQY